MDKMKKSICHGTVTVGAKGQIVIPADARESLNFKPGDKLIAIEHPEKSIIAFCHVDKIQELLSSITDEVNNIRDSLEKVEK